MISIIFALFFIFLTSDEYAKIREISVDVLRERLIEFAKERNLTPEQRDEILGILSFNDFYGEGIDGYFINYTEPDKPHYIDASVVIFGYYAEWCPNCHNNLPVVKRLYRKYREKGLAVVLNFLYSDEEKVRKFIQDENIPFPVLIGSENREVNPEVRLQTTHYLLRTILEDYRNWGTPFYIIYVKESPDVWYIVSGEMIEEEVDEFLGGLFF